MNNYEIIIINFIINKIKAKTSYNKKIVKLHEDIHNNDSIDY